MILDADDFAQERALAELEGLSPDSAVKRAKARDRRQTSLKGNKKGMGLYGPTQYWLPVPRRPTDDRNDVIRAAYQGGQSVSKIARVLGLTPQRVAQIVKAPPSPRIRFRSG